MAKTNKISTLGLAILRTLQDNNCVQCGQKLNQPFLSHEVAGVIPVTDSEAIVENIEHIVPESKGGKNTLSNYVLKHFFCNVRRQDVDYHVYAQTTNAAFSHAQVLELNAKAVAINDVLKTGQSISDSTLQARIISEAKNHCSQSSDAMRRTLESKTMARLILGA